MVQFDHEVRFVHTTSKPLSHPLPIYDQVSYIRFASVYKESEEPEDFQQLVRARNMKGRKRIFNGSSSSKKKSHRFDSIVHGIWVLPSIVLAAGAIVSLMFGNLMAAILLIFFSVVFAIMGFKIRCLKLKAGPFEAEAYFK